MLKPVRRIVTANDANDKSEVFLDGPASNTISILTELWLTDFAFFERRPGPPITE